MNAEVIDPAHPSAVIRRGMVLTALGLLGVAAVMVMALRFTPLEATQGLPQKIFYIHAPSAWCAMLAVVLTGLTSILTSGSTIRDWIASPHRARRSVPSSVEWC